jgi:hypothetical protein
MRKDVTTLGKLSLNFFNAPLNVVTATSENQENNFNETFVNSFYKALSQFITMVNKQRILFFRTTGNQPFNAVYLIA